MSKALFDLDNIPDTALRSVTAAMKYFPLCCSTGLLNNVQGTPYTGEYNPSKIDMRDGSLSDLRKTMGQQQYLYQVMDLVRNRVSTILPVPEIAGYWYVLSKIHAKCVDGYDDCVGQDGYSKYKAACVTWMDRLNEDKRSGKRFNSYNTTLSCDHMTSWLEKYGRHWGHLAVSPAVEGAHGARVRGAIFTPDVEKLTKYMDTRRDQLIEHYFALFDRAKGTTKVEAADSVAALF